MKQTNISLQIGKVKFSLEYETDETSEKEVHDDLFAVIDAVISQQRRLFQSFDQRQKREADEMKEQIFKAV